MQRRLGEHGTKVYFVKQLQVKEGDGADADRGRWVMAMPVIILKSSPAT
jgi:hypothetical protein